MIEGVERVSVVGTSGSGKTTFASALAKHMSVPHMELDAIFHQPGWTELPTDEFRAKVEEFASAPRWVIDGNYSHRVQDLVWKRADTVIWLDVPRRLMMRRIITRTLSRVVRREELWSGNRETWRDVFSLDPHRSIIAWAWTRYPIDRDFYDLATRDPRWSHLHFIRLTSEAEMKSLLEKVPTTS
jgi:adenylate kinase family enzyme